jgi:hypothetical protein
MSRLDSPRLLPTAAAAADATDRLMSKGWVLLPAALPSPLVVALQAEFTRVADRARESAPASLATGENAEVLWVGGLDRHSELVFDLARHERLLVTVSALLGRGVLPFRADFLAGAGSRSMIPSHQDQAGFQEHFDDELAVTLWCPLTGPPVASLEYGVPAPTPGSLLLHRPHPAGVDRFRHHLVSDPSKSYELVQVSPGDILVHHAYAVYRGADASGAATGGENGPPLGGTVLLLSYRTSPFRRS